MSKTDYFDDTLGRWVHICKKCGGKNTHPVMTETFWYYYECEDCKGGLKA